MPQDVADGLKRGPILQEMESICVAQAMRPLIWDAETAFASRRLKGFRNGSGFQFNRPIRARIRKKTLRYGAGGGVRFRCFTITAMTSLVSGNSKGEEVLR